MKISRFVANFEKKVEEWERNLSRIAELIEALLQVQKQWIHLESIFGGLCHLMYCSLILDSFVVSCL